MNPETQQQHQQQQQQYQRQTQTYGAHQQSWQQQQRQQPYNRGGRGGRGQGGGRGRGKGSSGKGGQAQLSPIPPEVLRTMATHAPPTAKHPNGQEICRNFILGRCAGGCGRAHNICPRLLPSGQFCFKQHRIRQCLMETPP